MKKIEKTIGLIDNGYGISQMMEAVGVEMSELIELMKQDEKLNRKLRRRFGDAIFDPRVEPENGDPDPANNDGDSPEMASLKQEAKELGISFNPNIGYEKLKARVDEFKAKQQ